MTMQQLKSPPDAGSGTQTTTDIRGKLADARRYAPDADTLAGPIILVVDTGERCLDLQVRAAKNFAVAVEAADVAIDAGAREAAAGAGASAVTFQDRQTAQEAARAAYVRKIVRQLRDRAGASFAEEASKLGADYADAMMQCKLKTDAAEAKATSYTALSQLTTLNDSIRYSRLTVQIKGRGTLEFERQRGAAAAAGDWETVDMLDDAGEEFLLDLVTNARRPKGGAATNGQRVDDGGRDRTTALRMLAAAAERRKARVPASVMLAKQVYAELLVPAFRAIVGVSAWDLPRAEMSAIYAGGGRVPGPFDTLPGWVTRYCGFSPDARTGGGARPLPGDAGNPVAPERSSVKRRA